MKAKDLVDELQKFSDDAEVFFEVVDHSRGFGFDVCVVRHVVADEDGDALIKTYEDTREASTRKRKEP